MSLKNGAMLQWKSTYLDIVEQYPNGKGQIVKSVFALYSFPIALARTTAAAAAAAATGAVVVVLVSMEAFLEHVGKSGYRS